MTAFDLIVIGAGPGGYVAAIRAAQLGFSVACIEKEPALGGTCLRVGCIPSKAMLESSEKFAEAGDDLKKHGVIVGKPRLDLAAMLKRKDATVSALTKGVDGLFAKNRVTRFKGHGRITGPNTVAVTGDEAVTLNARFILIATGSKSATLPGIEFDGEFIGDSTTALSYTDVPGHLVVIGAGVIGLELGSVWLRLGAKVTVLEYMDTILPGMDGALRKEAHRQFKKQGFDIRLSKKVTGARRVKGKCEVSIEGEDPITCDRVLVAVGRKPNTDNLGLENVGITTDRRGCIPVDAHFQTSAPGVFAVGDVIAGPMLAHKAEEEGIACVEMMATGYGHVDYDAIPSVVYTHPEIASVGRTEEQLIEQGRAFRTGVVNFIGNGRARALGQTAGFVKVLADATTDRVLGVHIIGARAGDMIAECAVAMAFGASAEDIGRACHAHPTLAEIVKEAALAVDQRSINA